MAVRHAFSIDEWHHMGEIGLFGEAARMELLDGEVIEMSPIGSRHASCVNRLVRMLVTELGSRAIVASQNPVVLDDTSEPQPDVGVLSPRPDEYSRSHARPSEILLLVEVSDTTLAFDRDRKAPYYANAGIRECWIVDLTGDQILVMRAPDDGGYRDVRALRRGQRVDIEALPSVVLEVANILDPPSA
jgi:Uma2 family endonuclease